MLEFDGIFVRTQREETEEFGADKRGVTFMRGQVVNGPDECADQSVNNELI